LFFDGIASTPPSIPLEYDLSLGCGKTVTIPTSDIDVGEVTLCGTIYAVNQIFANQSDLLSFLNSTLLPSFGLLGVFSIDADHLIYSTSDSETCFGTNCIELNNSPRIDVDDNVRTDVDGNMRLYI